MLKILKPFLKDHSDLKEVFKRRDVIISLILSNVGNSGSILESRPEWKPVGVETAVRDC